MTFRKYGDIESNTLISNNIFITVHAFKICEKLQCYWIKDETIEQSIREFMDFYERKTLYGLVKIKKKYIYKYDRLGC